MSGVVEICGVKIDNLTFQEAIHAIETSISSGKKVYVVTPNVDHIVRLQHDREFRHIYEHASLVLPDGMPLLWASKLLGNPLQQKISGSDLLPALAKVAATRGYRLFFLGGREGAAERAAEVLEARFPSLRVVGIYSPPFGFEESAEENDRIVKMINTSKPDILFVGLGSPKQEKWIFKYKNQYETSVAIGVGVSFEFISGMVKRAPVLMQRHGLEWFWRLSMEPKRLWKRYLIEDINFVRLVFEQKFGKGPWKF